MKLKMWNNIKLNEIRKHAKESLSYKDFNACDRGKIYLFYLYFLPICFALILLNLGILIEKEIATYLITSISVFAGLFFSLLFIVTEKFNQKKEYLKDLVEKGDNQAKNYLKRYKNFATFLIRQISFTIILAFALILSMSVVYFAPKFPHIDYCWFKCLKISLKYLLNGVIYYWGMQFIIFLTVILSNMYVMLLDDINFEKDS